MLNAFSFQQLLLKFLTFQLFLYISFFQFYSIKKLLFVFHEKQKEVFLLSRIEKMKYREIAEMLEISVKAVEKRMHLALLEMKEKIGNV